MWKKMPNSVNQSTNMTKELTDGIKTLLGKNARILHKNPVKLEVKGDKTENRILVLCPCRLFCVKIPNPRIDFHFHYLEIQSIESKRPNQVVFTVNDKSHSFVVSESENVDKIIQTLLNALNDTFPGIPLSTLIRRIHVVPPTRLSSLDFYVDRGSSESYTPLPCPKSKSSSSLGEDAGLGTSISSGGGSMDRSLSIPVTPSAYHHIPLSKWGPGGTSSSPCGGFSTQYAWMCDLHGLPYREEVAWDVDTILHSHDSHELCLRDFDHLEPRDSVPILSALEYNTWFKALRISNVKLSHESIERFFHVIKKSSTLEELYIDNINAKTDFALKLSSALNNNSNSQVHTLDLSHNMIEDKGAIHLSSSLGRLCRGPQRLNFSYCGLSAKGVAQIASALLTNRFAPNTLTHLNLSGNSLKDDINSLCNFLAQPNSVTVLDLSGTDCTLETVFGALLRGSTSHLSTLNLSRNNFATKKGKEIPPSFKQYLTSSLALKHLSLSACKLSLDALKQLLLGLACNESAADVELDVSGNGLGAQGAHVLESCLPGIKCLASLDISDNNLEVELAVIVSGVSKNKSLKNLNLSKNLLSTKPKHVAQVMEAIVQVLQDEDCVLESLSLADSKLKGELYSVINALGSNQCLQSINITGNQMTDVGARLLAKALQINTKLRSIVYDKNNITIQGFSDIAYGLESNTSVRYMPFPVHDATACMKVSAERTETTMRKIQELVYRNSQPKKTTNGHQALRLQQGFLLSSAQQTVDKLITQTQESIKQLQGEDDEANKRFISQAELIIHDSERAKQLILNLHEILEPKNDSGKSLESKLGSIVEDLQSVLSTHVEGKIEDVMRATEDKTPNLLTNDLKTEIKEGCLEKGKISNEFVKHCVLDLAGTDILNKLNDVHMSVAAYISDKLLDTVIDSLVKTQKQLSEINKKRSLTPDVLRTRLRSSPGESGRDSTDINMVFGDSHLSDGSPMATPQLHAKRRGLHGRRIRPKSVVDCIEGISADDIPDLLPSLPKTIEEGPNDLPPESPQQLKHLGKTRPKKQKTRAPTRPSIRTTEAIPEVSEGIDTFFRPESATPTMLVTPDSDECSTSLMISSMTSAGGDEGSLLSTPTHSSRTFKADDPHSEKTSPSSFDSGSLGSKLSLDVPRSKSSDSIEKPTTHLTPTHTDGRENQKSPIPKHGVIAVGSSVLAEFKARQDKRSSQILNEDKEEKETISVSDAKEKFLVKNNLVNRRPPPVAPKPRPWSVLGADRRSGDFSLGSDSSSPNASSANTPDAGEVLDDNGVSSIETVSLPPASAPIASKDNSSRSSGLNIRSNVLGSSPKSQSIPDGPVSLPSVGWSVKEMAASLAKQNEEKKKGDSLPRGTSPPVATNPPDIITQEISKTRVSVQEWNRVRTTSDSVTNWRAPLRKISAEIGSSRPISKRWEVSNEEKS